MSSSTSSSEPAAVWRRFFTLAAGTTAAIVVVVYAFVVLVDPWGSLPWSLPLDRVPVTSNQRFAYPALARSREFDSAVFGTSTSRLLRPAELNPEFGARFANLAMNDATPYEISRLLLVFAAAHASAKVVMVGIDSGWCVTGNDFRHFTGRPFPEWMYHASRWVGYARMFDLFAVQEAGKQFGVVTGLKREDMGRDGYTRFVPPDDQYDPVRAAVHLQDASPRVPSGERSGPPATWRYPALDLLRDDMAALPPGARKILFFVPYNHRLFSAPGSDGDQVWSECKRRVANLAQMIPHVAAVDFMRASSITTADDNYWDPLHYRVAVADQVARDLGKAARAQTSPDYRLLTDD